MAYIITLVFNIFDSLKNITVKPNYRYQMEVIFFREQLWHRVDTKTVWCKSVVPLGSQQQKRVYVSWHC